MFRWEYDYVEYGEVNEQYAYGLTELDDDFQHFHSDPEDWSMGSSSSYSPGARSPSVGFRSPIDESETLWEGETLASGSDGERR